MSKEQELYDAAQKGETDDVRSILEEIGIMMIN
jgi:hypothetical protein